MPKNRVCLVAMAALAAACMRPSVPIEPGPGTVVQPRAPEPPALASHAAAQHTCALDLAGIVTCWGRNDAGQLGSGDTVSGVIRVAVARRLRMVAVGGHTCALDQDGVVLCWGDNRWGQLGDGSTAARSAPAEAATERRFVRIAAGAAHTCALDRDGRAFCWGDNRWGQLGNGTRTGTLTPGPVRTAARFVRLAPGSRHTCGISAGGEALCWGDNFLGQLGLPRRTASTLEPVPVPGLPEVVALSAGHGHSCAIGVDGNGWCWGQNGIGQLGSGAAPGSSAAVPVARLAPLSDLRVGYHHTCAVDLDGAGWCWGANSASDPGDAVVTGQLGREASWSNLPLRITLDEPLASIAPADGHTCALTRSGAVYCFGSGRHGQLGRTAPVRSSDPVHVLSIEPGPPPAVVP